MDYGAERRRMVEGLVRRGYLREGRVFEAMLKVRRHLFVPEESTGYAYVDSPQPIGCGQTISAPHMVAMMTELLDVERESRVLEVGLGSGYQAAVLAELAGEGMVVSVERVPELAEMGRRTLAAEGYVNVRVVVGDGTLGWPKEAPYDRIIVTAAAPHVPSALVGQLAPGGRMLLPAGGRWSQTLTEVVKDAGGMVRETTHGGCVFVPLIGVDGWRRP